MIEPAMMATSIAKEKAISAHDKKRERERTKMRKIKRTQRIKRSL